MLLGAVLDNHPVRAKPFTSCRHTRQLVMRCAVTCDAPDLGITNKPFNLFRQLWSNASSAWHHLRRLCRCHSGRHKCFASTCEMQHGLQSDKGPPAVMLHATAYSYNVQVVYLQFLAEQRNHWSLTMSCKCHLQQDLCIECHITSNYAHLKQSTRFLLPDVAGKEVGRSSALLASLPSDPQAREGCVCKGRPEMSSFAEAQRLAWLLLLSFAWPSSTGPTPLQGGGVVISAIRSQNLMSE